MKITSTAGILGLLITWSCCALDMALPDQPAPPLNLEKLLQAPPGAVPTWDALKGKVVVLEFWATWCGPCIAAVPHLNELADEFEKQAVLFIAITDEKESVVQPFLRRKTMHAWVGLDTDRSTFKEYGITGIPHTVIVGTNGIIAAVTHPNSLSATHIKNVLAGKAAGLPKPSPDEERVPAKASDEVATPLFQVLIRPSDAGEGGGSSSSHTSQTPYGKIYTSKITGWPVSSLVLWAAQTTEVRLITNSVLPDGKFDVTINVPSQARERIPELMREALHTAFGLVSRKEQREMDGYTLTAKNSKLEPSVSTGGSSSSSGAGRINAVNTPVSSLARSLEYQLAKPVFDDTGLIGGYDFQLKWKQPQGEKAVPAILISAVRDQLGLDLTLTKRPVEVTIVEVEKPSR